MKRYRTDQCISIQLVKAKQGQQYVKGSYSTYTEQVSRTHMRVIIYANSQPIHSQLIRCTYTEQTFGGERKWFICPVTGQKAQKLYLPPIGHTFGTSKGHNLAYPSQNTSGEYERTYQKLMLIKERCNGVIACKPKRMHQKTYLKHLAKWEQVSARFTQLSLIKLKKAEEAHQAWLRKVSI